MDFGLFTRAATFRVDSALDDYLLKTYTVSDAGTRVLAFANENRLNTFHHDLRLWSRRSAGGEAFRFTCAHAAAVQRPFAAGCASARRIG